MTGLVGFVPRTFHRAKTESRSDVWEFYNRSSKTTVICKLFAEHQMSDGLLYEATVYEHLATCLPRSHPFFVNFVHLHCVLRGLTYEGLTGFVLGRSGRKLGVTHKTLLRNLTHMQCEEPSQRPALHQKYPRLAPQDNATKIVRKMTYTMIVTEKCVGRTLKVVMADPRIKDSLKRHMLGRLIRAVRLMHRLGICHNDLHWDNVLVQESPPTYEPMLFDWDRAQMLTSDSKTSLENVEDMYGVKYSETRDWLFVLSSIVRVYYNYEYVDALLACFVTADTPVDIRNRWWCLVGSVAQDWQCGTDTVLAWFGPYVSVDVDKLLLYFNRCRCAERV